MLEGAGLPVESLILQHTFISQSLEGLALTQTHLDSIPFTSLRGITKLSLSDMNENTSTGNRSRTACFSLPTDSRFGILKAGLQQLFHLQRFELKSTNLTGCLHGILKCIRQPLEYLSLSGSSLSPDDLRAFEGWKFSRNLKDVNLSKLVAMSQTQGVEERFEVKVSGRIFPTGPPTDLMVALVELLQEFPSLSILDLHGNRFNKDTFTELSRAVPEHLKELKLLRLDTIRHSACGDGLVTSKGNDSPVPWSGSDVTSCTDMLPTESAEIHDSEAVQDTANSHELDKSNSFQNSGPGKGNTGTDLQECQSPRCEILTTTDDDDQYCSSESCSNCRHLHSSATTPNEQNPVQNLLLPDDKDLFFLVSLLKEHLFFQSLYVTRTCCRGDKKCTSDCKIAFWSQLDQIVGHVPIKVCVEMN